jgi:LysR family glycine cleavage system transcriptional activator
MMPHSVSYNLLNTFVTCTKTGEFLAAARELNITPTAVSKNIRTLENQLGVTLFRRSHRKVELTAAGNFYAERLSGVFERIEEATKALLARERRETLTICAFPSLVMRWLIPRWSAFKDAHPDIDVRFTTTLSPVDFDRDAVDAVILAEDREFLGYDAEFLFKAELVPVCSPALIAGRPPLENPNDLQRHNLLHAQTRPNDWARWLAAMGIESVDPRQGMTLESTSIAYQGAIEGLGVAMGIRELIPQDLARGLLVAPFHGLPNVSIDYFLVAPERMAGNNNLRRFRDWIIADAQDA